MIHISLIQNSYFIYTNSNVTRTCTQHRSDACLYYENIHVYMIKSANSHTHTYIYRVIFILGCIYSIDYLICFKLIFIKALLFYKLQYTT